MLLLAACASGTTSERRESRAPSERIEAPGTGEQVPADTSSGTARNRDRDPEAEKRKMAESRARSEQAVKMLRLGRLADAVASSRAALKVHEQNVEAMLVLAEVFYRQGKYELVHAVTSSALAVDEKIRNPQETSRAYNLKGFAYLAMKDDERATQAFRRAAESDEKNAAAWNNLGTRYLESGDVDTALSCFRYALQLQPRFAKAHLNYGATLRAKGDWVAAEKALQTALGLQSNYAEAYFNLGLLYLDAPTYPGLDGQQKLERAISYFERYKAAAKGTSGPVVRPAETAEAAVVSVARAEDYIRVAHKGLEREKRRTERAQKRQGDPPAAATSGGGTPAAETPPASAAPAPGEPSTAPQQPARPAGSPPPQNAPVAPQKPGGSTPSPSAPPTRPSTGPTPSPQRPVAPQKPSAASAVPSRLPSKVSPRWLVPGKSIDRGARAQRDRAVATRGIRPSVEPAVQSALSDSESNVRIRQRHSVADLDHGVVRRESRQSLDPSGPAAQARKEDKNESPGRRA